MCVDVGREFGAPTNIFYKPPCVSVYRCGGCCHSEDKQCRNISTGYLSKTVSARVKNPKLSLYRHYENILVLSTHAWEIQGDMSGQKGFWVLPASQNFRGQEQKFRRASVTETFSHRFSALIFIVSVLFNLSWITEPPLFIETRCSGVFFVWNSLRETRELCVRACVCFVSAVSTHKVRNWRLLLLQPN